MQVKNIAECSKGSILQYFSTFIKLPFSIKTIILSIFKWPLKTGFTVIDNMDLHYLRQFLALTMQCPAIQDISPLQIVYIQAFRFMMGPGHCPMISKYGPSLSWAVGPVDPSFLVVKKSHINKNIHPTASLQTPKKQKVHVGSQYSKTYQAATQKRQNKDLNKKMVA